MQLLFSVNFGLRFFLRMFFVVASIGVLGLFSSVQADEGQELLQNLEYEPGQLVLKLKEGAPEDFGLGKTGSEELNQIFEKYGVVNIKESPYGEYMEAAKERNELSEMLQAEHFQSSRVHEQNRYIVILPEETDIEELAQEISQYELVEYAQPNYGGIADFIQNNERPRYVPGQVMIKLRENIDSLLETQLTGNPVLDTLLKKFEVKNIYKLPYQQRLENRENLTETELRNIKEILERHSEMGLNRLYTFELPPSHNIEAVAKAFSKHFLVESAHENGLAVLLNDDEMEMTATSESSEIITILRIIVGFFIVLVVGFGVLRLKKS